MLEVLVAHCWGSVLLQWLCCRAGSAVLLRSGTGPGLGMAATLCSGALSVVCSQSGSQQPVQDCAASGRSCRGEPCEPFPPRLLRLCSPCSAARSKGGGEWFLRGHTSKSGISAWLRSTMGEVWLPDTSMVSQLSLWPADGVERILLFGSEGNNFSSILDLELEQQFFFCAFFPPHLLLNCIRSSLLCSSLFLFMSYGFL